EKRIFGIFGAAQAASSKPQVELDPRFEIDTDDNNYLRGTTTLYGNLLMADGAVQFNRAGIPDDEAPREKPSIYRALNEQAKADELRIDLGEPGSAPKVFVIGLTTDDGTFQPSLKLEYAEPEPGKPPRPCLTIYGDLKLQGLINSREEIDRTLSKET